MKIVTTNRKAKYDYHVIETWEAGIVLFGSEVKSLRDGLASVVGAFISIKDYKVILHGMHIDEYKNANSSWNQFEANRNRVLLLKKKEIRKIEDQLHQKGFTLVPLKVFFNDSGLAKVEIALCQGKKNYDKRQAERKKQDNKEMGGMQWK